VSRANAIAIEDLARSDLDRRFPYLGKKVIAATFSERDAVANPRLATPATGRAAQAHGATIIENCNVTDIEAGNIGFELRADDGHTFCCKHLVNSAGAWAADIAARFGEPVPAFAAGPPQFVTEPVPYFVGPSIQTIDGSVIARQIPRGNIILAGYPRTASDPVANRAPVPPHKTLAGMAALASVIPALAQASVIRVWSGIEAYLPDMIPIIGPSRTVPNLFHAFGFCGHGYQIGPGVGLCLSEWICDGHTPTPLEAFSIGRFKSEVALSDKFTAEFD
jgi:sarcosine oxidase subunit beta